MTEKTLFDLADEVGHYWLGNEMHVRGRQLTRNGDAAAERAVEEHEVRMGWAADRLDLIGKGLESMRISEKEPMTRRQMNSTKSFIRQLEKVAGVLRG